jgi:hypothetical protein
MKKMADEKITEIGKDLYYKHAKVAELDFGDSWYQRQKVAEAMGF